MLKLAGCLFFTTLFFTAFGEKNEDIKREIADVKDEDVQYYGRFQQEMQNSQSAFTQDLFDRAIPFLDGELTSLSGAADRPMTSEVTCEIDRLSCAKECEQGRLMLPGSGCCACTCERGYALGVNGRSCYPVSWTDWSGWSTCITSDWGGLQRRERICKLGKVTKNGRCVGAGSESRTCNCVTQPYRLRKNIRSLTYEEIHDLIQAFTKYKADNSTAGYMNVVRWHGWPYRCPWYKHIKTHPHGHCSWHSHPLFPFWHRMIMVNLEMGLSKYLNNKTLGFPYWDWTERGWMNIPRLFRDPEVFDPIINKYVKNPFYTTIMTTHKPIMNQTAHSMRYPDLRGLLWNDQMQRGMIRAYNLPTYAAWEYRMESSHNQIHNCMCSRHDDLAFLCNYGMPTVTYAAFDPLFMLHHSQIDRILVLYKRIHEEAGDEDWTESSFVAPYREAGQTTPDHLESFDWPLSPFCNETMNPNSVTLNDKVWTVRNSFYAKQLFGYEYDSLDLSGDSWHGLVEDWKKRQTSSHYGHTPPFQSLSAPYLGRLTVENTYFKNGGCTVPN